LAKLTENQILDLKSSFECINSGDNFAQFVFTGTEVGTKRPAQFPLAEFATGSSSSGLTALQLCEQSRTNTRSQLSALLKTTGGTITNPLNPLNSATNIDVRLQNNQVIVGLNGRTITPVPFLAPFNARKSVGV
jgi:hypothetical protein